MELAGEDVLEDESAVIPYCVVFWVLGEEFGGLLKGGVGVVFRFDLLYLLISSHIACQEDDKDVHGRSHLSPTPCKHQSASAPSHEPVGSCLETRRRRGERRAVKVNFTSSVRILRQRSLTLILISLTYDCHEEAGVSGKMRQQHCGSMEKSHSFHDVGAMDLFTAVVKGAK